MQQIQLDEAVARLGDRGNRIDDVAHDLGYSDTAHFTRAFRHWTGSTPGAFRDAVG